MGGDPFAVLKLSECINDGQRHARRMGGDPFAVLKRSIGGVDYPYFRAAWGETLLRY